MAGTLAVVAFLVLAVIAVLAIPASVFVRLDRVDRFHVRWRFRWLFGLVDVQAGWPRAPTSPKAPKLAAEPAEAPKKPRRRWRRVPAALQTPGLAGRAARLLADLWRQIRVEHFHLHATFGLDDPADTGRIYGMLAPALLAATAAGANVRCRPAFTGATLEGSVDAGLRVRPLSMARVVGGFLLSRPVFRAVRAWRSRR